MQEGADVDVHGRRVQKSTRTGKVAAQAQPVSATKPMGSRPAKAFQWLQVLLFIAQTSFCTRPASADCQAAVIKPDGSQMWSLLYCSNQLLSDSLRLALLTD